MNVSTYTYAYLQAYPLPSSFIHPSIANVRTPLPSALRQVCRSGSVHVPFLMHVESYATVHQLVTTVRGTLRPAVMATEVLRQTFPPGSMTGAPKIRSCDILEAIEEHKQINEDEGEVEKDKTTEKEQDKSNRTRVRAAAGGKVGARRTCARGIYSGCLGFFALSGAADFNVVIRTAVMTPSDSSSSSSSSPSPAPSAPSSLSSSSLLPSLSSSSSPLSPVRSHAITVGVGGAIVYLSDPEEEYQETLLKARAVLGAIRFAHDHADNDAAAAAK